jgi:hypothetical protein
MQKVQWILIAMLLSISGLSQKKSETIYYAWINKIDRSTTPTGYLIALKEDYVIHFNKNKYSWDDPQNSPRKTSIPINTIESFSFRKSDSVGKGALKGALWGGGIMGLLAVGGNDGFFSTGKLFAIATVIGVIPGALIGTATGARKMHFYINGEQTSYQKQKEKLEQFLLKQEY